MENQAAGISIIAFIVAVGVSMGYYQFVYLPQANAKPILPALPPWPRMGQPTTPSLPSASA